MPGPLAVTPSTRVAATPPPAARHSLFRTFLSELNPLQYIPVVGGIYRAITGDTIPETARTIGSFVVSALTGGPVGVAMNVAALAAEKATGIDPEKLEQHVLASLGIGGQPAQPAATTHPALVAAASVAQPIQPATPWSRTQLQAYGVTSQQDTLQHGPLTGSDVLNDLELRRLA